MKTRYTPHICPQCKEPAYGTVERLAGCALLKFDDDAVGLAEYTGNTKVWWEEQKTVTSPSGRVRMICYHGHEWWASMEQPARSL